ncbi:MAG: hypothetical protein ABI726_06810 [bacterium]
MIKSKLQLSLGILAVAAVMALGPASALGQGSSIETYAGGGGGVGNQVDQGAASADPSQGAASADPSSGTLPFTGLDLGLVVGTGLLLIATGTALTRLVVRDREA